MFFDLNILESAFYLIGFIYSILLGSFAITRTQKVYYTNLEEGELEKWRPQVIGLIERGLYTATILAGFPGFIAIWLALKAVGHWERWKLDWDDHSRKGSPKQDAARGVYMGYLLGNGLSIAYSLIAVQIIFLLLESDYWTSLAIAVVLPLVNWFLYLYIKKMNPPKK